MKKINEKDRTDKQQATFQEELIEKALGSDDFKKVQEKAYRSWNYFVNEPLEAQTILEPKEIKNLLLMKYIADKWGSNLFRQLYENYIHLKISVDGKGRKQAIEFEGASGGGGVE